VVQVKTSLTARQLLDSCLGIERKLGRVRPADGAKRSRVIDIDVLLFGEQTIDEPGLQVPHPALLTRPFVRIPLADVATPGLSHPRRRALGHQHPRPRRAARVCPVAYAKARLIL